jgi:hypothetical protein
MPNTSGGGRDSEGYSFLINASPDEIEEFYEAELAKLGWKLEPRSIDTDTGVVFQLVFMKDTGRLIVTFDPQPNG